METYHGLSPCTPALTTTGLQHLDRHHDDGRHDVTRIEPARRVNVELLARRTIARQAGMARYKAIRKQGAAMMKLATASCAKFQDIDRQRAWAEIQ
jgi:hypothetical protein